MSDHEISSHLSIHDKENEPEIWIADLIDRILLWIGKVVAWANGLLIGVIIFNVVARYGFGQGHPAIEELQWHLYALAVMMGISYAQVTDSHVRVDVIAMRLSDTAIRFWEIFGILFFVFPFIWVVFYHSLDFFEESWRLGERSDAPIGLCCRWAIKSVIPIAFLLLFLATLTRLMRNVAVLLRRFKKA